MGNRVKGNKVAGGRKVKTSKSSACQKQGGATPSGKRKRTALKSDENVPQPKLDEDEIVVSDEDFEFVRTQGSRLKFLTEEEFNQDTLKNSKKQKFQLDKAKATTDKASPDQRKKGKRKERRDDADLQEYEECPRQNVKDDKHERAELPIKTQMGEVVFENSARAPVLRLPEVPGVTVDSAEGGASEGLNQGGVPSAPAAIEGAEEEEEDDDDEEETEDYGQEADGVAAAGIIAPAVRERARIQAELQSFQEREAYREQAKASIAAASSRVVEDPEKNVGELRSLLGLCADGDGRVASWAMLSLLLVFRDVLPGYRIRLPTAAEEGVKVSKEVARLRQFEAGLLRAYQGYLKLLLQASKKGATAVSVLQVAVKCLSGLLETHFYFNYARDILNALVPRMADRNPQIRGPAAAALAAVVQGDQEGQIAMEAVQLVADLVKKRSCRMPPDVVWAMLNISVTEVSREEIERLKEAAKGGKIKKLKKKKGKTDEERQLEKDFRESAAEVDVRTKVRLQSRMLDALFEIFFRVLKAMQPDRNAPAAGSAPQRALGPMSASAAGKRWPLLEPTLAGVEKFSHLISIEFFGDLLGCLASVSSDPRLPSSMRARALLAISGVLSGQGASLAVDHHSYHVSLYRMLLDVPIQPLDEGGEDGGGGGGVSEPNSAADHEAGQSSDAGMLLLKALERSIVDPKSTDATRLSSFLKRSLTTAMGCESGEALGLLCAAGRMLRRHAKLRGMLEGEVVVRSGSLAATAHTKPEDEDPAVGGWLGCPLWELSALARHYHPEVASTALGVASMGSSKDAGLPPAIGGARGPAEVAEAFSTRGGAFRPAPKAPDARRRERRRPKGAEPDPEAELLGGETAGRFDDGELSSAMAAHFRSARSFARNAALRRELRRSLKRQRLAEQRLKGGE